MSDPNSLKDMLVLNSILGNHRQSAPSHGPNDYVMPILIVLIIWYLLTERRQHYPPPSFQKMEYFGGPPRSPPTRRSPPCARVIEELYGYETYSPPSIGW